MDIVPIVVGPLETNCYVLVDGDAGECLVIDPGAEAERIAGQCSGHDADLTHILATHAHADHVGALAALKRRFPDARVCIGREDAALLGDRARNLSAMLGLGGEMPQPDRLLEDGDLVEFGQCVLRVMETPGHTRGEVSLVAEGEEPAVVFCGDLIFRGGVGRTDLPGGDEDALRRSIARVLSLDDETVLMPGHGEPTTVGREKQSRAGSF